MRKQFSRCGILNESGAHSFIDLHAQLSQLIFYQEGLGSVALLEFVCCQQGWTLRFQKPVSDLVSLMSISLVVSLSLPLCHLPVSLSVSVCLTLCLSSTFLWIRVQSFQLFLQPKPACLLNPVLLTMMKINLPLKLEASPLSNAFFNKSASVVESLHRNKRVTKIVDKVFNLQANRRTFLQPMIYLMSLLTVYILIFYIK